MKQFILLSLIAALMPVMAIAGKAQSAAAAKPAATVLSVSGKPQLSTDGGKTFKSVKLGQSIPVGALIRSGSGKLSLLLSEGSTVLIGSNTEMTLKAHNPEEDKGGTVFGLAKGFARFIVAKLGQGKKFEVETPNAVAAVKGTDFVDGVDDDGHTQVTVFESPTNGLVEMSDLDRLKSILISENGTGTYDGKEFKTGSIDAGSVRELLDRMGGPPPSKVNNGVNKSDKGGEQGNGEQGSEQGGEQGAGQNEAGASQQQGEWYNEASIADQLLYETVDNFFNDYAYEQAFDQGVKSSDINELRVVYDHKGYQTLVTQSTVLSEDKLSILNATTATRNAGPDIGTSYALEDTTFNRPLPDLWADVFYRKVGDALNIGEDGMPKYFRTFEYFEAGNPVGDVLAITTNWHDPDLCVNCGNAWEQGYSQNYVLDGMDEGTIDLVANLDVNEFTSTNGVNPQCQACTDNIWFTASDNLTNQGVDFTYYNYSKSGSPFLTQSMTAHDDGGVIYPTTGLSLTHPNDYRAFGESFNISTEFFSPCFSQSIDLIFLNPYFKSWDIIQVPTNYSIYGGGG